MILRIRGKEKLYFGEGAIRAEMEVKTTKRSGLSKVVFPRTQFTYVRMLRPTHHNNRRIRIVKGKKVNAPHITTTVC